MNEKNYSRRTFMAGVAVSAIPAAAIAAEAAPVEHPMVKARRLAAELSETLRDLGELDYVMVRPAGGPLPVLYANQADPEQTAKFYLRAFQTAMEEVDPTIKNWQVNRLFEIDDGIKRCPIVVAAYTW